MTDINWYIDGFTRIIAQNLNIENYDVETLSTLNNSIISVNQNASELLDKFKTAYNDYNSYYENTYNGKPFTINEIKEYNILSDKMNHIRTELLEISKI